MCKISWLRKGIFCWATLGAVLVLGTFAFPLTAQEAQNWKLGDYMAFVQGRGEPGPPSLANPILVETGPGISHLASSVSRLA
jgi:hypothetical protein